MAPSCTAWSESNAEVETRGAVWRDDERRRAEAATSAFLRALVPVGIPTNSRGVRLRPRDRRVPVSAPMPACVDRCRVDWGTRRRDILISEGNARRYLCGATSLPGTVGVVLARLGTTQGMGAHGAGSIRGSTPPPAHPLLFFASAR